MNTVININDPNERRSQTFIEKFHSNLTVRQQRWNFIKAVAPTFRPRFYKLWVLVGFMVVSLLLAHTYLYINFYNISTVINVYMINSRSYRQVITVENNNNHSNNNHSISIDDYPALPSYTVSNISANLGQNDKPNVTVNVADALPWYTVPVNQDHQNNKQDVTSNTSTPYYQSVIDINVLLANNNNHSISTDDYAALPWYTVSNTPANLGQNDKQNVTVNVVDALPWYTVPVNQDHQNNKQDVTSNTSTRYYQSVIDINVLLASNEVDLVKSNQPNTVPPKNVTYSSTADKINVFMSSAKDNNRANEIFALLAPEETVSQLKFQSKNFTVITGTNSSNAENSTLDVPPVQWYPLPVETDPNDRWSLSVTSAYYDHRIDKIVVLMASEVGNLLKTEGSKYIFMCVLFFTDESNNSTTAIETEGSFFTSYMFYCPLTNVRNNNTINEIPKTLTIRRNDRFFDFFIASNWTVPIVNLLERKNHLTNRQRLLALCVHTVLYGHQDWLTLIQFIEFHRIQGVEKFIFFYEELDWSTEEIFNWYTSKFNFIELIKWKPDHMVCKNDFYRCQLIRDNLCTYSLMYKYKYVGNSGFHELFSPVEGKLTDLLERLDHPQWGSFQFRAKFHQTLTYDTLSFELLTHANLSNAVVDKFLPLVHYNNVSTYADHFFPPKTIAKPETVLKRWVHFVAGHIEGSRIYLVNETTEGFFRHFKIQQRWDGLANNADQVIKYGFVDPKKEVGQPLLAMVLNNVKSIVLEIKSFTDENTS